MSTLNWNKCEENEEHEKHLCAPVDPNVIINPDGVGMVVYEALRANPNSIAQINCVTGEKDTYETFLTRSICIAENMLEQGVQTNDIISVCFTNNMNTYPIAIATFFTGAVLAALDPVLSLQETIDLLKMIKPKLIFCDSLGLELIETALNVIGKEIKTDIVVLGETNKYIPFSKFLIKRNQNEKEFEVKKPESIFDTFMINFSSGTTGTPKGICTTHYSTMYKTPPLPFRIAFYAVTRIYWFSALTAFIQVIRSGSTWIIDSEFDMTKIFKYINDYKISIMFVPPYYASQMIKHKDLCVYDTSNFKIFYTLGGPLSKEQVLKVHDMFKTAPILSLYGISECGGSVCSFPFTAFDLMQRKFESVGLVLNGVCIKIVDLNTNKVVGVNQEGEIRIKTCCFMKGYYKDPEATKKCLDEDGYFCTGDVGYYDDENCLYVVDRIKDMIKFRAFQVAPIELEGILQLHPDVAQVVVVGVPHAEDGDLPTAIIVLQPGATTTSEELINYVNDQVVDYKKLRGGIKFVKDIPKTPTFKLRRRDLRNMILSGKL